MTLIKKLIRKLSSLYWVGDLDDELQSCLSLRARLAYINMRHQIETAMQVERLVNNALSEEADELYWNAIGSYEG